MLPISGLGWGGNTIIRYMVYKYGIMLRYNVTVLPRYLYCEPSVVLLPISGLDEIVDYSVKMWDL